MRWFKIAAIGVGILIAFLVVGSVIGAILHAVIDVVIVAAVVGAVVAAVKIARSRNQVSGKKADREVRDREPEREYSMPLPRADAAPAQHGPVREAPRMDVEDDLARLKREMGSLGLPGYQLAAASLATAASVPSSRTRAAARRPVTHMVSSAGSHEELHRVGPLVHAGERHDRQPRRRAALIGGVAHLAILGVVARLAEAPSGRRGTMLDPAIAARLKRDASGLVAAIAQQYDTGEVLMLGWMDDEALHRTLTTGRCTYWSRSRREYWVKGGTSGHYQQVKSVALDCDGDALVVKVDQTGGACHTGDRTCFDADVLLKDQ